MFGQRKLSRSGKYSITANSFQKLEHRNLLAGFTLNAAGQLFIGGTSQADVSSVSIEGSSYVAVLNDQSESFAISDVDEIYFLGFGGDDTFTNNTSATITIYGHAGNDTLNGGPGRDVLIGGSGNDTIYGNDGNDRLVGANGNDLIYGGNGNDEIFGSAGTNELHGEAGDDVMYGSDDGDDMMYGNDGLDWMFGLGGDDMLHAGDGGSEGAPELIMGHGGRDTFFAGAGLNLLWGGDGDDTMTGGDNADNRMHGQAGDDVLVGGNLADLMRGHAGNDILTGMGGDDTIQAGSDDGDVVRFTKSYADSTVDMTAGGQDGTVTSNGADRIQGAEWLEFSDRQISTDLADLAVPETASFTLINNYRSSNSRAVFTTPSDLTAFAENWAREMANGVGLAHSPLASRNVLRVGDRTLIGENVIQVSDIGQTADEIATEMHNAWRNSATHNANMLNRDLSEIGVGIYKSGGFWWGSHVFAG